MVGRPTKFICYRGVLSIHPATTLKGSKHSPNQSKSLGEGCNLPWGQGASKSNLFLFISVRKTMNIVVFEQMRIEDLPDWKRQLQKWFVGFA